MKVTTAGTVAGRRLTIIDTDPEEIVSELDSVQVPLMLFCADAPPLVDAFRTTINAALRQCCRYFCFLGLGATWMHHETDEILIESGIYALTVGESSESAEAAIEFFLKVASPPSGVTFEYIIVTVGSPRLRDLIARELTQYLD